ncbi:MAG: phenylalanine--tRNA ligase subunit beta [Bdellovibrionales bacterium]
MKFTLGWLKQHLETTASLDDICNTLTAIGLEVEEVHDHAKLLAPFTVALIEKADKHPDADRLKVCTVDTGKEKLQIVCGAPNARAGIKVVLSRPGDFIPGLNITLGQSKIRGVESQGMLCAADELGLGDEHEGIMELPETVKVGAKLLDAMPALADAVIDINLTPNRGDCAGVHGVARDLAAAGIGTLKPLKEWKTKSAGANPLKVVIEDPKDCPAIGFRMIRGVKNGPSPAWLRDLLENAGMKSISTLVDITNYFTMDRTRPLHVFDADKMAGSTLTIRRARKGEKMTALNNKEYDLTPDILVIADEAKIESIGGVIGGLHSGCSASTTNVILEVAYFSPANVAANGRLLQINTDARYRFERGLDPQYVEQALESAAALIIELCGGTTCEPVMAGTLPKEHRHIHFFPDRVSSLTGVDVPAKEQQRILAALGCSLHSHKDHFDITPPSWRPDLNLEEDLVEEVLRIHGYDNIPATPLPNRNMTVALNPAQRRHMNARRALAARGLAECVTWSFMPKALAAEFNQINPALTLVNPISADLDQMRPSILGNLLQAAASNFAHGQMQASLFEIGPVFSGVDEKGQELVATGLRSGKTMRHWQKTMRDADIYNAKADVMALLEQCGLNPDTLPVTAEAPHYYHPGRSGVIRLGPTVIAAFGDIHPAVAQAAGVEDTPAVGFEVYIDRLPQAKNRSTAKPLLKLPPLQPVRRDFAFVVDISVAADRLVKAIRQADKNLIVDVQVFDVYQGDKIQAGKKSVAIAVTLQPQGDKAFTDVDLEKISAAIVASATKATGAVLR